MHCLIVTIHTLLPLPPTHRGLLQSSHCYSACQQLYKHVFWLWKTCLIQIHMATHCIHLKTTHPGKQSIHGQAQKTCTKNAMAQQSAATCNSQTYFGKWEHHIKQWPVFIKVTNLIIKQVYTNFTDSVLINDLCSCTIQFRPPNILKTIDLLSNNQYEHRYHQ